MKGRRRVKGRRRTNDRRPWGVPDAAVVQLFLRISTPLTGPRHVVPEYGILIESVPSSAVPLNDTAHDGRSAAVAVPLPDQLTVVPLSVP